MTTPLQAREAVQVAMQSARRLEEMCRQAEVLLVESGADGQGIANSHLQLQAALVRSHATGRAILSAIGTVRRYHIERCSPEDS